MRRDEKGQALIEELVILILVVLPLIVVVGMVIKKLSFLYQMADLLMKVNLF